MISLPPNRVVLWSRMYEKYKLEKISLFSKAATFLDFVYWFDQIFGKSRQRISTRTHAFSTLLNWEQYHLLHTSLTVYTLEEVRRYQHSFLGLHTFFWKTLCKVNRRFSRFLKPCRNVLKIRYWSPCGSFHKKP